MGERKGLNKYYPPNFDPAKIPRLRQPRNNQIKVRSMLPMPTRCNRCGNSMSEGTKFNTRKESITGDKYLGQIQIYRFYFRCGKCSAEFTVKTHPKKSDFVAESGCTRRYEPWHAEDEEAENKTSFAEEMGDAMKTLENRTLDSKRDMDSMAALNELRSLKSRHAAVSFDAMLEGLRKPEKNLRLQEQEKDEALIRKVFHNRRQFVRRIPDEGFDDADDDERHEELDSVNNQCSKKRKVSE